MKRAHLLLTNDDGIYAEGIQGLARVLLDQGKPYRLSLVAPDRERSAMGHAITMHKPLRVEEIAFFDNPDLQGWAVNGTPSDCVKLALEALLQSPPDLLISGVNRGSNLGTDVLYSGTVSAAVEGLLTEIPSVAVSLTGQGNPSGFDYAARFTAGLIPHLLTDPFWKSTLLNINVPSSVKTIRGARATRLGSRKYRNAFEKRFDPRGMCYYWLAGELVEEENEEADSDTRAVREGFVSVTPVHFQLTNTAAMPGLASILEVAQPADEGQRAAGDSQVDPE